MTKGKSKPTVSALAIALPMLFCAYPQIVPAQETAPGRQKCSAPAEPRSGQQAAPKDQNRDLSRKLDDCNGVLKAPGVGDDEMVEPAPETGNTRIIKPGTLPPDSNPSNGSGN